MKTVAYVAIALVAAASGFGIYRYAIAPDLGPDAMPAETAVAEPAPAAEPAIPATLPEFTLADRDGNPRSILSWPGKSMIVNFWATWCAPCRREIPLLRQLQRKHGDEGFQIVGVAVDFREDVIKYANEMGIDYPLLIGEQDGLEAVTKFGVGAMGFPFTVFTDDKARIIAFHLGELTEPQADVLLEVVRQVNRGELTPDAAQAVAAKQLAALPGPAA